MTEDMIMNKVEEVIQLIMQQNEMIEKQTELLALLTGQVVSHCEEEGPEGHGGCGCGCGH